MSLIFEKLFNKKTNINKIIIKHRNFNIKYKDILESDEINLSKINQGDVVALVGDYDGFTIKNFLKLVDKKVIIVPLTNDTKNLHSYYFDEACVDFVICNKTIKSILSKNS